ncbi:MAG: 7-carboxy-7-deazaguanine synthase QueE [Candidatus Krumholzibacteriales bacterium]
MSNKGYLDEVFCSMQGEGLYLGYRQVFVRTGGCGAGCVYCDTRRARSRREKFEVYGPGETKVVGNPVEPERAVSIIRDNFLESLEGIHSVSITGGEPLEQPEFVGKLAGKLREAKVAVYLETNGLHPESIAVMKPFLNIVSLDIKQPALCPASRREPASYRRALRELAGLDFFCKIVLCEGFSAAEFRDSVITISGVDRSIPLVIQPASATQDGEGCRPPEAGSIMDCYSIASGCLDNVRVIPQCHKILGIR